MILRNNLLLFYWLAQLICSFANWTSAILCPAVRHRVIKKVWNKKHPSQGIQSYLLLTPTDWVSDIKKCQLYIETSDPSCWIRYRNDNFPFLHFAQFHSSCAFLPRPVHLTSWHNSFIMQGERSICIFVDMYFYLFDALRLFSTKSQTKNKEESM